MPNTQVSQGVGDVLGPVQQPAFIEDALHILVSQLVKIVVIHDSLFAFCLLVWISRRTLGPTRLPELQVLPCGQYDACARRGWPAQEVPARLADLLRAAELRGVDCVIMDTAAGLNGMSESVVKACDYVILPQQAEPLAVRSVPHMLETLSRFRAEGAGVKVAGILLTMVMTDSAISQKVVSELRAMLPADLMFEQNVPRLSSFLEASAMGVPVALLKKNPPPEALIFDQIAAEIEQRAGLVQEREASQSHASLLD